MDFEGKSLETTDDGCYKFRGWIVSYFLKRDESLSFSLQFGDSLDSPIYYLHRLPSTEIGLQLSFKTIDLFMNEANDQFLLRLQQVQQSIE